MKQRSITQALTAAFLFASAAGAQATTNFEADVNAAIDAGLNYSRSNGYFTSDNEANGLTLLTLLEKTNLPAGYAGLSVPDKALADASACILMTSGNYAGRGSFYSYYDGQALMALSVYALTGGPNNPSACSTSSVRDTINAVVDRSLAQQSKADGSNGGCPGMWSYTGPGCDSSTTQFAGAGLAAAKGYYLGLGDSSPARLPGILTALDLTSNGYAANGILTSGYIWDTCGAGCFGHGYGRGGGVSNQQTASGTWLQLLGTGKNINNAAIQGYLRWLQNAYNYDINTAYESWPSAYLYYLWSSSKAYVLMENAGVPPSVGNIGPASMGTLPVVSSGGYNREANRSPLTDPQVPLRGSNGAGWYSATTAGWYYDYAYRLMSVQAASGFFPNPQGSFWSPGPVVADHAYAILVLQRAVGGIVVISKCDANVDGAITKADLAIISAARGKPASGADDPRDSDNDGKITILDVKKCVPLVH